MKEGKRSVLRSGRARAMVDGGEVEVGGVSVSE